MSASLDHLIGDLRAATPGPLLFALGEHGDAQSIADPLLRYWAALNRTCQGNRLAHWLDLIGSADVPIFPVSGRDLLGIDPGPVGHRPVSGPALGSLIADLKLWWLTDGCRADRAACLDRARDMLARQRTP